MDLNEYQKRITGEFMRRIRGNSLNDSVNKINLFISLRNNILRANPRISKEEFEREISERMEAAERLSKELKNTLKKYKPGIAERAYDLTANFFEYFKEPELPFSEQVKSFRINQKMIKRWLSAKPVRIGRFTLKNSIGFHPEEFLSINISKEAGKNIEGVRVASIGGYLYFDPADSQIKIRVTNVQGKSSNITIGKRHEQSEEKDPEKRKLIERVKRMQEEHKAQYQELNKILGENWRVFLAKRIKGIAEHAGLEIVADLPLRFTVNEREYRRQARQYTQTYRKAGFTPERNKRWGFTPKMRRRAKSRRK